MSSELSLVFHCMYVHFVRFLFTSMIYTSYLCISFFRRSLDRFRCRDFTLFVSASYWRLAVRFAVYSRSWLQIVASVCLFHALFSLISPMSNWKLRWRVQMRPALFHCGVSVICTRNWTICRMFLQRKWNCINFGELAGRNLYVYSSETTHSMLFESLYRLFSVLHHAICVKCVVIVVWLCSTCNALGLISRFRCFSPLLYTMMYKLHKIFRKYDRPVWILKSLSTSVICGSLNPGHSHAPHFWCIWHTLKVLQSHRIARMLCILILFQCSLQFSSKPHDTDLQATGIWQHSRILAVLCWLVPGIIAVLGLCSVPNTGWVDVSVRNCIRYIGFTTAIDVPV